MGDETKAPEGSGSGLRPGYRTTEFWLSTIAVLIGAVMASGLAESSPVMRVAGIAATVLGAMGYSVSRGMSKRAPAILIFLLPLFLVGCCKGHVRAEAVLELTEAVTLRHDRLIDGKPSPADQDPGKRASHLRSSELLRKAVQEAAAQK